MSRRRVIVAVIGLAVLGCDEARDTAPTGPELQLTGAACKYSDVKKYARNLFGSSSPGYDKALAMSVQTPNSAAATNLGFDILAVIATRRNAPPAGFTGTEIANAANLALQVVRCSNVNVTGANSVAAYSDALDNDGAWEVRGGSSSDVQPVADPSTPVLALDKQAGVQAPGNDFSAWLGGRVLFYGYPAPQFAGERTGAAAGLSGRLTFDWSLVAATAVSLPRPTKGKFSLCVTVENDDDADRIRVQKTTQILEIATPVDGLVCASSFAAATPQSLRDRLIAIGEDLFTPAPLHAAALLRLTKPTGTAGSFSPFQVGNPVAVDLTFLNQPQDTKVNEPITDPSGANIQVFAEGAAGTPWEGVTIQMVSVNNNGQPTQTLNNVAVTNAQGIAEFPGLHITKTGGAKLVAATLPPSDPDVQGFVEASEESGKFNIRP